MIDLFNGILHFYLKPFNFCHNETTRRLVSPEDWPDFLSFLKDYRRLERQMHQKLFAMSGGSLEVQLTSKAVVGGFF